MIAIILNLDVNVIVIVCNCEETRYQHEIAPLALDMAPRRCHGKSEFGNSSKC